MTSPSRTRSPRRSPTRRSGARRRLAVLRDVDEVSGNVAHCPRLPLLLTNGQADVAPVIIQRLVPTRVTLRV